MNVIIKSKQGYLIVTYIGQEYVCLIRAILKSLL